MVLFQIIDTFCHFHSTFVPEDLVFHTVEFIGNQRFVGNLGSVGVSVSHIYAIVYFATVFPVDDVSHTDDAYRHSFSCPVAYFQLVTGQFGH